MKLSDEDVSKVMVRDLPEQSEYSQIIYDAQEVGKMISRDFMVSQEANSKAWTGIIDLMARCIARGMRMGAESVSKGEQAR